MRDNAELTGAAEETAVTLTANFSTSEAQMEKERQEVAASELNALLSASALVEPGYYWWLPICAESAPHLAENWSVVAWHPLNENRQKSGWFVGPLKPPIAASR